MKKSRLEWRWYSGVTCHLFLCLSVNVVACFADQNVVVTQVWTDSCRWHSWHHAIETPVVYLKLDGVAVPSLLLLSCNLDESQNNVYDCQFVFFSWDQILLSWMMCSLVRVSQANSLMEAPSTSSTKATHLSCSTTWIQMEQLPPLWWKD